MIIATRPEPTVRLPSRFSVGVIDVILCDFQGFFRVFFFDMHLVSEVLWIFVIMVLSRSKLHSLHFQYASTQKETLKTHLYELINHCLSYSILTILSSASKLRSNFAHFFERSLSKILLIFNNSQCHPHKSNITSTA